MKAVSIPPTMKVLLLGGVNVFVFEKETRTDEMREAETYCCNTAELLRFKQQADLFEKSLSFRPDIFGDKNPHYILDWTFNPEGCVDHVMLGQIWMTCEQLSDQAGYSAYLKLGWQDNKDKFTTVYQEARRAFLLAIPRPEDITFLVLPNSHKLVFIEHMEKEADDHAEDVVINLMVMM